MFYQVLYHPTPRLRDDKRVLIKTQKYFGHMTEYQPKVVGMYLQSLPQGK